MVNEGKSVLSLIILCLILKDSHNYEQTQNSFDDLDYHERLILGLYHGWCLDGTLLEEIKSFTTIRD